MRDYSCAYNQRIYIYVCFVFLDYKEIKTQEPRNSKSISSKPISSKIQSTSKFFIVHFHFVLISFRYTYIRTLTYLFFFRINGIKTNGNRISKSPPSQEQHMFVKWKVEVSKKNQFIS